MSGRGPGRPAGTAGQQGRDAILAAARTLLAEAGSSRVTLRMVADRAGVRAPLVHYYFGSKAELFEAVMEGVAAGLRERLLEIVDAEGSASDRLRAFVASAIRAFAEDPFAPRLLAELIIFPDDARTDRFVRDFGRPNAEAMAGVLREGMAAGEFTAIDPRMLIPAMMGAVLFYFLGAPGLRRMFDFEPFDAEAIDRYAEFVGELLLRGIGRRADADG